MTPFLFDLERLEDDQEYRDELRHRTQTDFFFLAPLLGFHDFHPIYHAPLADFYPTKCPGVPFQDWDTEFKNRMHLDPRHTFKTSAGKVDNIQTIINDANITIANVTATRNLSTKLTKNQAGVFLRRKNRPLTVFQRLWPEYLVDKLNSTYTAPCRTIDAVEPTLYATSVGSSQSGEHPCILCSDDTVDTENSGIDATDQSREHVWNSYNTNLNTLRLGGYNNIRGTRYHPFDLYGRILRSLGPLTQISPGVFTAQGWKIIMRASVRRRDGERLIEGEWPPEEELELLWPDMLSYDFLRTKYKDYRSFMCQQNNDPQGGAVAAFPQYPQTAISPERLPLTGEVRICWRLASEAKEYMRNYSEGAAVLYGGTKVYVVDAWRGNYTPSELATRIISGCKRHQCGDLIIENTPGSESSIPHIQNEATRQNWSVRIERPDFQSDDAVRFARCRQLEPMMKSGRFWVSNGTAQVDELQNQFTHFGLIAQNGLVDTISRLALRIPASVIQGEITAEQREMHRIAKDRGIWDMIYGQGGAVEVEKSVQTYREHAPENNSYGLTPMLGGLDG